MTGSPKRVLHRDDAVGRLAAMQLQHVGRQRLDDAGKLVVGRVDRQRDLVGPAAHALAELARQPEPEMARRRREEHEADHVGAGVERRVERFRGGQAADFDEEAHASMLLTNVINFSSSRSHKAHQAGASLSRRGWPGHRRAKRRRSSDGYARP